MPNRITQVRPLSVSIYLGATRVAHFQSVSIVKISPIPVVFNIDAGFSAVIPCLAEKPDRTISGDLGRFRQTFYQEILERRTLKCANFLVSGHSGRDG